MAKTYAVQVFSGFKTIRQFAQCTGVHGNYIRRVERQYRRLYVQFLKRRDELLSTGGADIMGPAVFSYKCTRRNDATVHIEFQIPRWAVRLLTTALYKCKPVPLSSVRDEVGHGRGAYSGAYSDVQAAYIDFVAKVCTPLIELRIRSEEQSYRGREVRQYAGSRQIGHRSRERMFSACDVLDIIDKTILTVFTPLIIRTVPVRGIGSGLLVMDKCTVTIEDHSYTENVYDVKTDRYDSTLRHGYRGIFTNTLTGEQFFSFTESAVQAEKWRVMTACTAVIDTELMYREYSSENGQWEWLSKDSPVLASNNQHDTPRLYGNPALYDNVDSEYTECNSLIADSVVPMSPERAFNSVLVGTIRTHYRSMSRRTDKQAEFETEHYDRRKARKSVQEFPVYDYIEAARESGLFTDDQLNICTVEVAAPSDLELAYPNMRAHERKYSKFCDLRIIGKTAEQIMDLRTVSPKQFWRLRRDTLVQLKQVFAAEQGTDMPVKRTPVPLVKNVRPLPLWKKERKMDKRSPDRVIQDSLNCGVDRRTVAYGLSEDRTSSLIIHARLKQVFNRPVVTTEEFDLTPVQYPVLTRNEARHLAAVRAITGRRNQIVELDSLQVNGFTVPLWRTQLESWMNKSTAYETVEQDPPVNGISQDKRIVVQPTGFILVKSMSEAYYTDVCTADGDGI